MRRQPQKFCPQKEVLTHADVSLLCLRHLSSVLGSRFDHAAEATMPILLNLVPNSAKVIATSGVAAIRLILRVRVKLIDCNSCKKDFL